MTFEFRVHTDPGRDVSIIVTQDNDIPYDIIETEAWDAVRETLRALGLPNEPKTYVYLNNVFD